MTKRKLKAALARARAGKARTYLSAELKSTLAQYARERRADGATWGQVGAELGLREKQVSRLCQGRGQLQEVAVVADATAGGPLTLRLPGGAEVCLDVPSLAALLRAL